MSENPSLAQYSIPDMHGVTATFTNRFCGASQTTELRVIRHIFPISLIPHNDFYVDRPLLAVSIGYFSFFDLCIFLPLLS